VYTSVPPSPRRTGSANDTDADDWPAHAESTRGGDGVATAHLTVLLAADAAPVPAGVVAVT
jgi:hypothetical protein